MKYRLFLFFLIGSLSLKAQLTIEPVTSGKQALELLSGGTIQVESIDYYGSFNAIGKFTNNSPILNMKSGIYLGTGNLNAPVGPNITGGSSTPQSRDGMQLNDDPDLMKIASGKLFDQVILQFTFIPRCDTIAFQFVFGSEEYPEYVQKKFNDVFGFFIKGPGINGTKNMALLPDDSTPITINSVNMLYNNQYYIYNKPTTPEELKTSLQFDGFTRKLTAKSHVIPGQTYTIKIAIADVNDMSYDSGVFLEANSFTCLGQTVPPVQSKKDSVVATYTLHIEFPFNSSVIPQQYHRYLDSLYEVLSKNATYVMEVNGHTDNAGTAEYNKMLSEKRALAVKSYLIKKGIDATRISATGYGSSQPLNGNRNEKEKAANRRVVFVIKK